MRFTSLLVFIPLLLLSGCVGVGVVHTGKVTYERFRLDAVLKKAPQQTESPTNVSKQALCVAWGEPSSIKNKGTNREVWSYRHGVSFAGIVPMLLIEIPLVVPSGFEHTDIHFNGEKATKAELFLTSMSGAYYGPKGGADMESGFQTFSNQQ